MAITTLSDVKLYNGITGTDYDTLISADIPIVQEAIHQYTNKTFISINENYWDISSIDYGYEILDYANVYGYGNMDVSSSAKTITAPTEVFSDFVAGDDIVIYNSFRNNGYYTIDTVTGSVMTVVEDIYDATNEYMRIYMISYPKYVKTIAARMVGWDVLKRNKASGVASEHVGTYSVTFKKATGLDYPEDIVAGLPKEHRGY